MFLLTALQHLSLLAFGACDNSLDLLGSMTNCAAGPALDIASVLVPGIIGLTILHKLTDHQLSGGGFVIDMTVKAGGSLLLIQLIRALAGL